MKTVSKCMKGRMVLVGLLLAFAWSTHAVPRSPSPVPTQKSPDTPGSPEGNTEGPGTASSEPLLPS